MQITIKKVEIEEVVEELEGSSEVKVEITLSSWEAYSFIVAVQLFTATNRDKLTKVKILGGVAARRLHESLRSSCPKTYRLLNNGWNLQ